MPESDPLMEETPKEPQTSPVAEEKKETPKFVWTWRSFFYSFIWLAVLLFAIDLASKWAIQLNYQANSSRGIEVIPNFFYLYLTHNTKAAFGDWMNIGDDVIWPRILLIIISWVMSGAIGYYWYKNLAKNDHLVDAIFSLCLAGALGNAIDRTFYWSAICGFDGVIDFFTFYIFGINNSPFAIFNVADACLTVGVAMAIVVVIVREIKHSKAEAD